LDFTVSQVEAGLSDLTGAASSDDWSDDWSDERNSPRGDMARLPGSVNDLTKQC